MLPDGCVDIVWSEVSGALLVGPDTAAFEAGGGGGSFAGLRLRPGAAAAALGMPCEEVRDQHLDLDRVWGAAGRALARRLDDVGAAGGAAAVAEALLAVVPTGTADAEVAAAASALDRPGPPALDAVAGRVGLSTRQLHRRFTTAIGYGPRTWVRVTRLQRFVALAEAADAPGLAVLATEAGYSDQPHLTREVAALTGRPPAALLRLRREQTASEVGGDAGAGYRDDLVLERVKVLR